jgi:hypothetical protein
MSSRQRSISRKRRLRYKPRNPIKLTAKQKHTIQKRNKNWPSSPEGNGYDNNDGSICFGPPTWLLLGSIGRNYPVNPTQEDKERYLKFFISLGSVLPCRLCRTNFDANLQHTGFDPEVHLSSRQSFSRYINMLHNHVNKLLKKGVNISYEEHRLAFESLKAGCRQKTATREGGCDAKRGENDPQPRCLITILPKEEAEEIKKRKGCGSMIITRDCLVYLESDDDNEELGSDDDYEEEDKNVTVILRNH